MANYAVSGLGEKTACLELNGHGELSHWKECNCNGYFSDFGVHYYPEFKKEQIPVFMTRNYQKVIMDFGDAYWKFREELLRCDGKIFLLNINPWQEFAIKKMLHTMADESWGSIEAVYCSRTMQKSEKRKIEKEFGIEIAELPSIADPRKIPEELFSCMDLMLGQLSPKARKKPRIPGRIR